jgi:GNAT superfamily N-acetyltransferase
MQLTMRAYADEDDYWRIREFLREVYLLNGRRELSWPLYRFDYWRWHVSANIEHFRLEDVVFLWETAGGRLAAVLNPDRSGEAVLQVHPRLRTPGLEDLMLAVAEQHLAAREADGRRSLRVWADAGDSLRHGLLAHRGYRKGDGAEYQRRRPVALLIPAAPLPAGYTVRALGDAEELPARSYLSWQAFHPDEPDERYEGWEWYRNVQRAPLYRRDLDLVAVAPGGALAAFCTVWFDDVARAGAFEPVGTAPAYRRLGLGRAVMSEGLRRLQRLGATQAAVGSYSPEAHALYSAVGFTEYDLSEPWLKQWDTTPAL